MLRDEEGDVVDVLNEGFVVVEDDADVDVMDDADVDVMDEADVDVVDDVDVVNVVDEGAAACCFNFASCSLRSSFALILSLFLIFTRSSSLFLILARSSARSLACCCKYIW